MNIWNCDEAGIFFIPFISLKCIKSNVFNFRFKVFSVILVKIKYCVKEAKKILIQLFQMILKLCTQFYHVAMQLVILYHLLLYFKGNC